MAATLIPAAAGQGATHRLLLPPPAGAAAALEEVRYGLGSGPAAGPVSLEAIDWPLHCGDLRQLQRLLEQGDLELVAVISNCPTTLVAASALGLESHWPAPTSAAAGTAGAKPERPALEALTAMAPQRGAGGAEATLPGGEPGLLIHRGTLRSGDHLQTEGSVLLLGDVNPGARISAGGHVLVWGKLRGVAHAGRHGDGSARIVALQLRPLQLRIASAVARGPQDSPPEGMAEEARLEGGEIRIEPAAPGWPLD